MNTEWYCYILKNNYTHHKKRTYNGYTNDPKHRIRQHNQEIKGGARYTKKFGNKMWEMYVLIKGFPNAQNALQCEWRIKHPDNKRKRDNKYNSPVGRVKGLNEVLKLDRWTNSSTIDNTFKMDVWILKEYAKYITDLKDNINLHTVDKIDFDTVISRNVYDNCNCNCKKVFIFNNIRVPHFSSIKDY
ncbi:MAG: GIY-YIG nuclease [Homavirus sp.]|uniref:GIY-YIG nuclease n=1 Tax=Homavirus sp. TaxID=2487769 RepID=A0A3G5A443_9VIRU|nr:MAG: GIY-YIG nuclease [Homavirus sp.]